MVVATPFFMDRLWFVRGVNVSLRGTFLRRRFLCGDGVNGLGVGVNWKLVWRSE